MSDLLLYNTLTRTKERFTPLTDGTVGMYTCGPTVYHDAHIGNLRAYVFSDVLRRTLASKYTVTHVMNITDVGHLTSDADEGEDRMEASARKQHASAWDLAKQYTDLFLEDLAALNILPASKFPRATDHIQEQISLIQRLEERGYTYQTSDGVYFDTGKMADYGKLANLRGQELKAGARVEVNKEKKSQHDFAVWKFSPKNEQRQMEWPSPWGTGFPGWHIECSAMSMKYLGETFDIHTGGIDHIPIHHTNEIAQSEAATGKPFVRYWLHNEFLIMDKGKMSKSKGDTITLRVVQEKGYDPLAYRYLCLNTQYRKPLSFSWEALEAAQNAFRTLRDRIRMMPQAAKTGSEKFETRFFDAIHDDLNTPKALGVVWELLNSDYSDEAKHQSLNRFDEILGLGLKDLPPLEIPASIQDLIRNRESAREKNDFSAADKFRAEIESAGFSVDDTPAGPVIREK